MRAAAVARNSRQTIPFASPAALCRQRLRSAQRSMRHHAARGHGRVPVRRARSGLRLLRCVPVPVCLLTALQLLTRCARQPALRPTAPPSASAPACRRSSRPSRCAGALTQLVACSDSSWQAGNADYANYLTASSTLMPMCGLAAVSCSSAPAPAGGAPPAQLQSASWTYAVRASSSLLKVRARARAFLSRGSDAGASRLRGPFRAP